MYPREAGMSAQSHAGCRHQSAFWLFLALVFGSVAILQVCPSLGDEIWAVLLFALRTSWAWFEEASKGKGTQLANQTEVVVFCGALHKKKQSKTAPAIHESNYSPGDTFYLQVRT